MEWKKCSIKLSLVKSLEILLLFIELLIEFILFKGGELNVLPPIVTKLHTVTSKFLHQKFKSENT